MYSMSLIMIQYGDTALMEACRRIEVYEVRVLLHAGADQSIQNKVRNVCMYEYNLLLL